MVPSIRLLSALTCLLGLSLVYPGMTTLIPEGTSAVAQSLSPITQQQRVALVIGNATYEESPLLNPTNDATAMAEKLRQLGFEVLPPVIDADLEGMIKALRDFRSRLSEGGVGVFYYAGHGVEVDGKNYLVPIGAQLESETEAEFDAFALSRVIREMEAAQSGVNILIVDACRDNPFTRRWRTTRGTATRGLSEARPPRGTIIAYAAEPGNVAEDGSGRNSPFTTSLLQHMGTPELPIELMFKQVAADVIQTTNDRQSPWWEGVIVGDFAFNPQDVSPIPSETDEIESGPPTTLPTSEPVRPDNVAAEDFVCNLQPSLSLCNLSSPSNCIDEFISRGVSPEVAQAECDGNNSSSGAEPLQQVSLSNSRGVNLSNLKNLLAEERWEEAERETYEVMKQLANPGVYPKTKIEGITCTDLRPIDQLWNIASNGRFGFSAQTRIFLSDAVGGTPETVYSSEEWRKFANQVGWGVGNDYVEYIDSNYSLNAPAGHLPRWRGGWGGSSWSFLFERGMSLLSSGC